MAKEGLEVHSATITCPHCDGLTKIPLKRTRVRDNADRYLAPGRCQCNICGSQFVAGDADSRIMVWMG